MENRFGVKDFFLFVLLAVVIVVLMLGMKQNDRLLAVLHDIRDHGDDQMRELATLNRTLNRLSTNGVAFAPRSGAAGNPTTNPAAGQDPFVRIRAAEAMPGYAPGDWFVDSIPNTDKITPLVSGDVSAADIQGRIFESLISRDPVTLDWQPLTAASWTTQDNTKAYTDYVAKAKAAGRTDEQIAADPNLPRPLKLIFKLRPNITFSDGEPLKADDVVWTFNWIMNPKVEAPRERAYYQKIASVDKTADDEVTFTFREPYFEALGLAGGMNILPAHFYSKYSPDDFNKATGLVLGSGPYRMASPTDWSPGKPVELLRNERYWGEPPAFDRLVYRVIDNDLARLTTFRNGDVDTFAATPEQYNALLKDADLLKRTQHFEYTSISGGYRYIAWNELRDGKPSIFADKRVRQAMTLLTDRQAMCDQIMLGLATPSTGPFPKSSKQYDPNVKPWPFDVARAKAMLKEAGFTDDGSGSLKDPTGKPFGFKLTYPSGNATYDQMALFLKDAYAKAGINLQPDALDWSVFSQRLKNHDFEAITLGWSTGIEDDLFQAFHSSQIADGGDDFTSYKNPELDALIEQARQTVDESARMPLWRRCHAILHEDQPYTFLFSRKQTVFIDARVKNVQMIPLGLNDVVEWFVPKGQQKWTK